MSNSNTPTLQTQSSNALHNAIMEEGSKDRPPLLARRAVNVAGARENIGTLVVQKSGIQCYNCKEYGHVSRECQKPKRVKDASVPHKEKMGLCKQEEARIGSTIYVHGINSRGNGQVLEMINLHQFLDMEIWFKEITIKRVYYVEGLNHNLFSVGQFGDADLEVAFWKSTCYIRDLKGNDLLTGFCGTDLLFHFFCKINNSPIHLLNG
ncbi:integrase, catalytic region, zinc finger, CCHC-type containing protein [Tanacetum coccineum]|uniref:Integrase, catalytic region, zinc finger, CCHC-type containing protein n=1 Tax=Tanacetum coccineum TaxID=301880 RepID=A0ABQ5IFM6_9ASTR